MNSVLQSGTAVKFLTQVNLIENFISTVSITGDLTVSWKVQRQQFACQCAHFGCLNKMQDEYGIAFSVFLRKRT